MATQTRNTLKSWFVTAAKPLQQQFWDWIDSFRHISDPIELTDLDPALQTLINGLPTQATLAALLAAMTKQKVEFVIGTTTGAPTANMSTYQLPQSAWKGKTILVFRNGAAQPTTAVPNAGYISFDPDDALLQVFPAFQPNDQVIILEI
jgi:hypothetical protein